MLERIQGLPVGVDGIEATGKVSKDDYERVFEPLVEDARREGRRLRFLYHFGPEFEGFTAGGAWEDAKLGLRSLRRFEGCAVVTDTPWIRESSRLAAFMMPCPVRVFDDRDQPEAVEWLKSLPEGPGISQRVIPESEVIVVEVHDPLRVQDFDALSLTADEWIEAHQGLRGLVIHAPRLPGWENIGSFLRHVRFVRDHHRKIKRVALAVGGKLADVLPRLAEHFVTAEIERFEYDDLEAAIAWAAEAPVDQPSEPSPRSGRTT